jgi:hypothetical protein
MPPPLFDWGLHPNNPKTGLLGAPSARLSLIDTVDPAVCSKKKAALLGAAFFGTRCVGYFGVTPVGAVVVGVVVAGRRAGTVAPGTFGLGAEGTAAAPVAAGFAAGAGTPDWAL